MENLFKLGSSKVKENIYIFTDKGIIELLDNSFYRFAFVEENDYLRINLIDIENSNDCIRNKLIVYAKEKIVIYKIEKKLEFDNRIKEVIDYKTFRNASAATFIRFEDEGVFSSFANPFCYSKQVDNAVVIGFEANLILEENEEFEFDESFISSYKISSEKLCERVPRTPLGSKKNLYMTRYHNPSTLEPLFYDEIRNFRKYTEKYLSPSLEKFIFEFYMYFSPVPPQPNTLEAEKDYYKYIDNFVEMGGDIIVFQPLQRQTPPNDSQLYWEVYKPDSIGERIVKYALNKGLKYGIYMGSAQENMEYCNSPMNIYVDKEKKPLWKKIDKLGNLTNENCICCDDFAKWYLEVQKNTILKYGMSFWNWDPGLGNGNFCYSDKHGHLPGKGAYKGFKNTQKIIKEIKNLNGGIYLQAFHGMKEYGLWGMKHFDQHEAYWEQDPGFFATSYSDFSADRITANGMRLQAWWNMNYRFLPCSINHSITHRMIQSCNNPEEYLRHAFDFYGYEFALMSALATGASITSPIIPYYLESPYLTKYKKFYDKWIRWAKNNFVYLKEGIAFGSQPDLVKVDGYARIIGDKGYIFLCNGNPLDSEITFELNESIGFNGSEKYTLKQIYPDREYFFDSKNNTGVYSKGDKITVCCPANTIILFEIVKFSEYCLYGIDGIYDIYEDSLYIKTKMYSTGVCKKIYFDSSNTNITNVYVNGINVPYKRTGTILLIDLVFGNKSDRYLHNWYFMGKNQLVNTDDLNDVELHAQFIIDKSVKKRLQSYDNFYDYDLLNSHADSANMYLSWSNPNKIYLVIPFSDAEEVSSIFVKLNGVEIETKVTTSFAITCHKRICYIADVTDIVLYGKENELIISSPFLPAKSFLGCYLVYPDLAKTKKVSAIEEVKYIFDDYLISNNPLKKSTEKNDGIKITYAHIDDFESYTNLKLSVKVNKEYNDVKKIICSCPIIIDGYSRLTMNTDRELHYNNETGEWEVEFVVGNRRLLIIDDDNIHIRAIDVNGFAHDYVLNIEWINLS